MAKYIKLMDGLKSNAGGFQYKIGKVTEDGSELIFNYDKLWQEAKEIYDILLNIKNS